MDESQSGHGQRDPRDGAGAREDVSTVKDGVSPEERDILAGRGRRPKSAAWRGGKTRKRLAWLFALAGGAGLLLLALWLLRTFVPESFPPVATKDVREERTLLGAFSLFFVSPERDGLVEEVRLLPRAGTFEADARTVIEALLAGPDCNAITPWPPETTIQEIFISGSGIIYVNFGGALRWLLPEGDFMEWSVMASLTRALCANFPEIRGVRVLVDGESSGFLNRVMPLDWTYQPAMFGGTWG